MRFSIITATFNAESCLETLISSVKAQKNENVEFIIVDGGSRDDTLNIIERNKDCIDHWKSEPDEGIYDAWNKGLSLATGDWIMFLGADDELLPGALPLYENFLLKPGMSNKEIISSKVKMIDKDGKYIRTKGWEWSWPSFLNEMTIAHPGALHSKSFFQKYGVFDTNYKITGDYEMLLRPQKFLKAAFMDETTVSMSEGGTSDSIAAMYEHSNATIKTGGRSPLKSFLNLYVVWLKFTVKKFARTAGLNVYLKKAN
jgi:glycosyltransferase involved in cell wall biosynthesis